jgi:deoxyribonuclease-4
VTLRLGAHVDSTDPIGEAAARDIDIVQFFLGDPQSWKKAPPREDSAALIEADIDIYIHAPYLVNVVNPNNRIRIPSRKILADTIERAEEIEAVGIIVHAGHVGDDEDVAEGFPRWRKALEEIETEIPILIENTAGGTNAMGRRFDVLERLWDEIGDLEPGFCLDTCHAWAGGEDMDGLVDRTLAITGRIDLVHLNDSRDPFDSRRDRHANLGAGHIPEDILAAVVREADAPTLLETPGGAAEHIADLKWIRERL